MRTLLRNAYHVEHLYRNQQKAPDQPLLDLIGRRYDAIVTSGIGYYQGLLVLPKKLKKDGTSRTAYIKRRGGHNLAEGLQNHNAAGLRFQTNPDVAFTNNLVERNGRMAKLKQIFFGCFRSVYLSNLGNCHARIFETLHPPFRGHCYFARVIVHSGLVKSPERAILPISTAARGSRDA